jgi:hypothetical protein
MVRTQIYQNKPSPAIQERAMCIARVVRDGMENNEGVLALEDYLIEPDALRAMVSSTLVFKKRPMS